MDQSAFTANQAIPLIVQSAKFILAGTSLQNPPQASSPGNSPFYEYLTLIDLRSYETPQPGAGHSRDCQTQAFILQFMDLKSSALPKTTARADASEGKIRF